MSKRILARDSSTGATTASCLRCASAIGRPRSWSSEHMVSVCGSNRQSPCGDHISTIFGVTRSSGPPKTPACSTTNGRQITRFCWCPRRPSSGSSSRPSRISRRGRSRPASASIRLSRKRGKVRTRWPRSPVAVKQIWDARADVGDPVSDFYTRHPYPPPVTNLDRAREEWQDTNRHRAEHHLLWPDTTYRANLDILIAGCGTWQAAKYALSRPQAHVVGIDVSTTSLEHTEQLRRKYGLTNLEAMHRSIESVGAMPRRFDLIVCTGGLHHLLDPAAGLRALRSVLKPDGVIYLMVYAPYGRTGIYMLQEYCRTLGVGRSDQDIADLRAAVAALPPQHPLHAELATSRDARNTHALADALLNPRDQSYSVNALFDLIEQGGM